MTAWEADVLRGYVRTTFDLGPDPDGEGDLVATLVRNAEQPATRHAALAIHGYTDYFFNTEFSSWLSRRGFAVYGLDLHKCGRSHRPGQTPHFTTDLARYDRELENALAVIAAETGNAPVCVFGHSAGGLIATLWLDRMRRRGASGSSGSSAVSGLVLNSPFFDLHGPAILRNAATSVALRALARVRKHHVIRRPTEGGYGTTLHRDFDGEFDYDLVWKPLGGFPVTFGWINAIRRGHARLHRGCDVGVPNLVLRSDHSVAESALAVDPASVQRGDAVLDVSQIARWAGCVGGTHTTVAAIADAKHDVFLSLAGPRAAAYAELDRWLDTHVRPRLDSEQSTTQPDSEPARSTRHPAHQTGQQHTWSIST
ncbi:alpha/beta hydrolase [Mycolicibacterium palauense]|uniref:alpha/beta hydrolase n=1 Tax=Mycolicibacterium palauense TaxID=2034511 RepID=UPI001FE75E5C|nr:alpha/beta hydrolase [Mycolicibacterium palauense]